MKPYSKFFYYIQEVSGISIYLSIIVFSILNTFLFYLLVEIFSIFDKRYGVIAALFVVFSPSSIYFLLPMYKDQLGYVAFASILLIVARFISGAQTNILKSLLLYCFGIFFIIISREAYVNYVSFILFLSLFLSLFSKPSRQFFFKNFTPFLFIVLVHTLYFHSDVIKSYTGVTTSSEVTTSSVAPEDSNSLLHMVND